MEKLSVINKTNPKLALPLGKQVLLLIKNDILGKNYNLSVAFVDEKTSQKINFEYRNKDNPTNVLSFLLSENEGELVLCPTLIKKESKNPEKNFGKNFKDLLGYLVIHGMLHLKGLEHGDIMDKEEKKYDQKYFRRDRRRIHNHASGSGRIYKRRNIS